VCDAAGVVRVHTPQELADVAAALSTRRRPRGTRVAVLADGGGHASIASDVAELAGLRVPAFSADLSARVAAHLPSAASTGNPIDVAGGGEQDISCFADVTDAVLASGEVDALVLSGYFGGYGVYGGALEEGELATGRRLAEIAAGHDRPVAAHSMFPASPAAREMRDGGLAVFRTIEGAVRSLAAVVDPGPLEAMPVLPAPSAPVTGTDYWSARALLADAGVPFPAARLVHSRVEAADAATDLAFPVVLKAVGLLHKSDAGGVVLGIRDEPALLAAYDDVVARLAPEACTVEEMADLTDGVELIVGIRQDPRFGPVALVGLGGVLTEVLCDVVTLLAPVTPAAAERGLRSLRGAPILTGVRGRPAVDVAAAAAVVARVTEVAAAHPELADVEVNPLLVTPRGALALDARVLPV
jgi:acyl-CoA synthetase (NDP forming)